MEKVIVDRSLLEQRYSVDGLSAYQIAIGLGVSASTIYNKLRKYEIPVRSISESNSMGRNPAWKGGRIRHSGYVLVKKPEHPRADTQGYVPEHILVWEETHGKPLPKGWIIHHLNGIKDDNRPRNLFGLPKGKHHKELVANALKQRIRELEIENRQLTKAMEVRQSIFYISEN